MAHVERQRLLEFSINELKRVIRYIETGRSYFYGPNSSASTEQRLVYAKEKLEALIKKFEDNL